MTTNLVRKLIPVALSAAAILPASPTFAAPIEWYQQLYGRANGIEVTKANLPFNLLLREETNVYADPGDAEPIGALAPQLVSNIEAYENNSAQGVRWYKVETWLGKETWIHANRAIRNYADLTGKGTTITIVDYSTGPEYAGSTRNNKTLYADAFSDTAITWISLAPQNGVEVVAAGNDGWYQIRTCAGIFWVMMPPPPPKV